MKRLLALLAVGGLLAPGCAPSSNAPNNPAHRQTGDGPSARDKDTPGPSSPTPTTPPAERPAESTGSR